MDDLSATVRRVDEDRWLASRFASAAGRARLMALYAVNYEIARTAEVVQSPMLGDIRFAWWREALEEIHAGKPARVHPALNAYAQAHAAAPFPEAPWAAIFAARSTDLEAAPFPRPEALIAYVDGAAGGLMQLAIAALDAQTVTPAFTRASARAWGFTGLLRAAPLWAARGRRLFPQGINEAALRRAAETSLEEARGLAADVPAELFPAVGYVALTGRYLRDLADPPPLLERQIRLIVAAARARF